MNPSADVNVQRLRVSDNGRYLEYDDGRPFFYLGDTAWELFHRLNRQEAAAYLENRARKGFTVIQAVLLAELDGLRTPNAYGAFPLHDDDLGKPNPAYFEHVDHIVDQAARCGLFMGVLPAWGDKWKLDAEGRPGIFNLQTADVYGRFLGQRYRDKPVVWILGGDRNIEDEQELAVIESLAHGLRQGSDNAHLLTYHPRGPGQSSDYVHHAEWLDFNMFQSSHAARDHDNGLFAEHDLALEPPKPTLDGEPRYETIPVGFYYANVARNQRFDAYDVRQAAYWSLLAGACGHTYGNNNVWQMWQPGRKRLIEACVPWYEALDHPGAFQMGHLRRLFESRPFQKLVPDQTIVLDGPRSGGAKIRVARAADGTFAFVYSPRGEPFTIHMRVVDAPRVQATWFDPRYGITEPIHTTDSPGIQTFTPPTSGRGCDWLLVLDDPAQSFPLPGAVAL
jgi:hypothetical protein